ncbi:hypothetical protein ACU4GI_32925 [Cupriavidus basilensis]
MSAYVTALEAFRVEARTWMNAQMDYRARRIDDKAYMAARAAFAQAQATLDAAESAELLASLPVYRFGSDELHALHVRATDGMGSYSWDYHGYRYIVDHGDFRTLNTLRSGQRVPHSENLFH